MPSTFHKLASFSVDHRRLMVVFLIVITAIATLGHYDANILLSLLASKETAHQQSINRDDDEFEALPNVTPVNLSRSDAIIVAESDNFFTPQGAAAMRAVVEDLETLDQVGGILWMDRVPILNIFGLPEPLLPRSSASIKRFQAAEEKAVQHPLVGGQLLSNDRKTTLLMITLDYMHVFSDEAATTQLSETARATAARFPGVDLSFQVTGKVPFTIAAISRHESNQLKYQLIGYGMILVMTIILFRGLRAVLIVALAPILGVFWTIGMIEYLGYRQNPLIDVILPVLVSLVGLTDGVHLMVQIRKLRVSGLSEREASRRGIQQVGLACFLTSLTTAIGFGSLTLAESQWVQEFGRCSVIGVILVFIAVVTVIPIACSTWLGAKVHIGHENSLIDRNLNRITIIIDAVLRRSRLMSILGIGLTLALFCLALTLRPDQRQSNDLPLNSEATAAFHHMDKAFGGLEFAEVRVMWSKQIRKDAAEILNVVTEVDELLAGEELIGNPLSIRNLIDAQPGSGPAAERMTLMELLPPPLKRAFFTPERREANVTFRVQDLGIAKYGPVFERLEVALRDIEQRHPEFTLQLDGSAIWRWKNLYQIVVDLAKSLGSASVVIFVVLSLVYRSVRIGLISIIPNAFPLVFTGGYLALTGYNLEIVMVCNFTICLGIAVDDTIHFLTRYLEERRITDDQDEAIRRAFTGVGTALIMTTTVLVCGFTTVTFSESRDHRIFATMGALTIGAALLGDLLFLPALLKRFAPRDDSKISKNRGGES